MRRTGVNDTAETHAGPAQARTQASCQCHICNFPKHNKTEQSLLWAVHHDLRRGPGVQDQQSLASLSSLRYLDIFNHEPHRGAELAIPITMPALEVLTLRGGVVGPLADAALPYPALTRLDLELRSSSFEGGEGPAVNLQVLASLPSLQRLLLWGAFIIGDVPQMRQLSTLTFLWLDDCEFSSGLEVIQGAIALRNMSIDYGMFVLDAAFVAWVAALPQLRRLSLLNYRAPDDSLDMSELVRLGQLHQAMTRRGGVLCLNERSPDDCDRPVY